MKTILVTGGAGFVGSHACKALSRAGHLPVTFDNLERGHERAVKWGPRGDLRNETDLHRAFEVSVPLAFAPEVSPTEPLGSRRRLGPDMHN
jgi:UDP-arabinose 4-epimerase